MSKIKATILGFLLIFGAGRVIAQTKSQSPVELSDVVVAQTLDAKTLLSLDFLQQQPAPPLNYKSHAAVDTNGNCRVHHLPLREATIPLEYGWRMLLPQTIKLEEAKDKFFPNSILAFDQGCVVLPFTEALVLHCSRCLSEREQWQQRNQPKHQH
jgi:hypothetical protein